MMIKLTDAMRRHAQSLQARIISLRSFNKPRDQGCHRHELWLDRQMEADALERYQHALLQLADATDCDECPDNLDNLIFEHDILPKLRTRKGKLLHRGAIDTKVWADQSDLAKEFRAWLGLPDSTPEHQPNWGEYV